MTTVHSQGSQVYNSLCEHGLILHHPCKECERNRALAILATLEAKETA